MREQRVREIYNSLAKGYDETFSTPLAMAENAVLFDHLRRATLGFAQGNVMDLGCGTGLFLEYVTKRADQYIGVDISEGMLEEAARKWPSHQWVRVGMEMADVVTGDDWADLAVSTFGSFSYAEPERTLLSAFRLLRPGGMIYIQPLGVRYSKRKSYILNQNGIDGGGETFYSARALRGLFKGAGFEGIKIVGFHSQVERWFQWAGERGMRKVLELEMATLGKAKPDWFYYPIVMAYKPKEG